MTTAEKEFYLSLIAKRILLGNDYRFFTTEGKAMVSQEASSFLEREDCDFVYGVYLDHDGWYIIRLGIGESDKKVSKAGEVVHDHH